MTNTVAWKPLGARWIELVLVSILIATIDVSGVLAAKNGTARKGSWHPKITKKEFDLDKIDEIHIYLAGYAWDTQKLVIKNDSVGLWLSNPKPIPDPLTQLPVQIEDGRELRIGRLGFETWHLLDKDDPSYTTISRHHAAILKKGEKLIISDVGSKNGTSLHVFEKDAAAGSDQKHGMSSQALLEKEFTENILGYLTQRYGLKPDEVRAVSNRFSSTLEEIATKEPVIGKERLRDFFPKVESFVTRLRQRTRGD